MPQCSIDLGGGPLRTCAMPASILERTSSARRGFLRTKSPTGRPMTSCIHVDIPSGRRRSSSLPSALAVATPRHPGAAARTASFCEWSRCNKYLQVGVARGVVTLQDHCARVIQHQLRLVELDWIGIVARKSERCGGIRTGLPITLHFGMSPRRRFARTSQTVVPYATCDEGSDHRPPRGGPLRMLSCQILSARQCE